MSENGQRRPDAGGQGVDGQGVGGQGVGGQGLGGQGVGGQGLGGQGLGGQGLGGQGLDLGGLAALTPVPTAVERAADSIRGEIFEGRFRPGTSLPEGTLAQALRVSRNTVREALRMLSNEHLLTYEVNRGVSVRSLDEHDVADIYAGRRLLELSAVDALAAGTALPDDAFEASLAASDRAASLGEWHALGTTNLRFHAELVRLHGSARLDEFFTRLATEMRLGFLALQDPEAFHYPYLGRNHQIADLLHAGAFITARAELAAYLDDAAAEVAAAVATARGAR